MPQTIFTSAGLRQAVIAAAIGFALAAPTAAQGPDFDAWRNADTAIQRTVLTLARRAFDTYVTRHETIAAPRDLPPLLQARAAVFVSTMGDNGAPRCCMGTLYATQPTAAEEIINNAVAAAGRDHRFALIRPGELGKLRLIVSIVSPPHPISEAEITSLDPTRDGLVVQFRDRSGVILSGETGDTARMLAWGRVRAGAKPGDAVTFFRIQSVRFIETRPGVAP